MIIGQDDCGAMAGGDMQVGFIGLGVMGKSMAGHLLQGGCSLQVFTRTRLSAEDLLREGAVWNDSPAVIARQCDVIFTIVGFPQDVEEVYFGADGLVPSMREGAILVDMTTSRPDLAKRIATEARSRGGYALDAPVSGGDKGARDATLAIMVGGDKDAFERVLPLFKLMGKNIVLQGLAGSGQYCKMCNQITIASTMLGVCEAMAYAQKSGLDPSLVLQGIASGAAGSWTLHNLAPRLLDGDYAPGFYVKHFIKDMMIAQESARALGMETPGLDLALSRYRQLAELGYEDAGTQALFKLYG